MMNQQLSVTNVNSTGGASNDSCGGHGHGSVSSSSQFQESGSGGGQRTHRIGRPNTDDLASSSSQRVRGSGGCGTIY